MNNKSYFSESIKIGAANVTTDQMDAIRESVASRLAYMNDDIRIGTRYKDTCDAQISVFKKDGYLYINLNAKTVIGDVVLRQLDADNKSEELSHMFGI